MKADTVSDGDMVSVIYIGTLDDGTIFDESEEPIVFQAGAGQMIDGFDRAVIGMKVGEEKNVSIPPSEAYGERNPEMTATSPKGNLESEKEIKVGDVLMASTTDGRAAPVKVINITEDSVTVDLNHPLAGETLNFYIKVAGIS